MGLYYYSIFFWSRHGSINRIELYLEIWNQTLIQDIFLFDETIRNPSISQCLHDVLTLD